MDAGRFDYVGTKAEASPMRLDLEEGAFLVNREIFLVNAAMDHAARPTEFFCGDPIAAHRAGESFVESLVRLDVPEQADVVLTNSAPMDLDLRQSAKCLGNSLYACKPGGVMLGCVRCQQGLGEMPLAKKGEPVEEVFVGHFGLQMLRRNHLALFSDNSKLPPDIGRKMGLARSFTAVQDMITWASQKAPNSATVWVVPQGGATYVAQGEWE